MAVDAGVEVLAVAVFGLEKHLPQIFASDIDAFKIRPHGCSSAAHDLALIVLAAKSDIHIQREHFNALRDDEFDREHGIKPAAKERQCLHFVPLLELVDLFLILQDPLDLVGRVGVFELLHQILQGVAA